MSRPDFKVGDSASITKRFSSEEVFKFAEISADSNPIHLDDEAAAESIFGQRVVHGMLAGSLFSALIGMHLPGKGSIYLGQNLSFKAPVMIDDEITATVEITSIREGKPIMKLRTFAVNAEGTIVIDGDAVVKFG